MQKEILIKKMIKQDILKNEKIISAFKAVKRENFILSKHKKLAYVDEPLPILAGQTISQPTTVAIMTEALEPKAGHKILEIGSGSGYQAAILSKIIGSRGKIYTIERIKGLYEFACKNLRSYKNVKVLHADGSKGYEKAAPYSRIIVTAAAPEIPVKLFEQLKEKGIMVIPVGKTLFTQSLLKIQKIKGEMQIEDLGAFVFVPLIGEFGQK